MDNEKDMDFGICVGCNEQFQVGQVLTVWDEETGHADCDKPFDINHEHPAGADWPPPVVLLGEPAVHVPLSKLKEVNVLRVGRWLDELEEAVELKDHDAFHALLQSHRAALVRNPTRED